MYFFSKKCPNPESPEFRFRPNSGVLKTGFPRIRYLVARHQRRQDFPLDTGPLAHKSTSQSSLRSAPAEECLARITPIHLPSATAIEPLLSFFIIYNMKYICIQFMLFQNKCIIIYLNI